MSNQDALLSPNANSQEPIPGYRLLERIGRGGYGEVWKTLAPGGVPKAIKLIYADDSSRMVTELRAINRIKDIRHPFLLSIERIEQHGELLAVVTELGDKNLQQHYQEFRAKQLPGVPQSDLLPMLRDVADVLDYIYQEYALQHLDIKPANLLLFGKRLKVADFGMVKNIYERSASLVHGLTPTYAAPEIFEGQPTRASDQYSLAILYQEMLTGILPFDGMTAARLATQHLRETPDLGPLPPAQRSIIARALSKDPQRRFSNCMEMIEELTAAARRPLGGIGLGAEATPAPRDMSNKQPAAASPLSTPTQSQSGKDTKQPEPVPAPDRTITPTIVIGVGGSAGKALQRLRLRVNDRLGGVNSLPAFKMLFLDVDHEALNEINHDRQAWSELETVPTPLSSSAEYREQGQIHRRWLSRRWLFNVPRNLRTEGLRPLGRLALMTNATRIKSSLRSAIQHVASACPGTAPRILLVGSISGGTGSGMLLDLAYLARHELRSAGFPEAPVEGVLLHSTPVGAGRDKSVLNAIATLCELEHYNKPGSFYPGEPLLQIPPFHGDNQVFASTQFLHLGKDLDQPNWLRAIDNVAEHLYCRLMTNLDHVLSGPRSYMPQERPSVDLVQVHQIGGYAGSFVDDLTRQLCVDLIDGWCGSEQHPEGGDRRTISAATLLLNAMEHSQKARSQQLIADSKAKIVDCGINIDQLGKRALEMLEQELTVPQRDFLQALFADAVKAVADDVPDHEVACLVVALQDQAFGLDFGERPADHTRHTLFDVLHPRLASQAMPIAVRYIGWVCDLIDLPTGGVDAARDAAEAGRDCIRDLISILGKRIQDRQAQLTKTRIQLMSPPGADAPAKSARGWMFRRVKPRVALAEKLVELGLCSFEELIDDLVHRQLRMIETNVSAIIDQLLGMWQELKQLGTRISDEGATKGSDSGLPTNYEQLLRKRLLENRAQLVQGLRTRFEQEILSGPKKLQRYLQQRFSYDQSIGDPLRHHSRQVVLQSINQVLCSVLQDHSKDVENQDLRIENTLAEVLHDQWELEGGSDERTVLVVPNETKDSGAEDWLSAKLPGVSIVSARTNSIAICRERRQATIQEVIQSITQGQDNLVTVAANLHARIDVEWKAQDNYAPAAEESEPSASGWSEVSHTIPLG